jgi:hypothetical protein
MRLLPPLVECASLDVPAVVAMPARAAVAVLIRSLSTPRGVTHHSPVVAVLPRTGPDKFALAKEAWAMPTNQPSI